MSLPGVLSLYSVGDGKRPYFTSGDLTSRRTVIFIGGLWSGLFDTPYLLSLSKALEGHHWKLVQIYWSGIYDGFGTGSLDRDCDELGALVEQLRADGASTIVIMGHSTGSQDVIHYLSGTRPKIDGGIMQAPASDRQFFESNPSEEWVKALEISAKLVKEGKGDTLLDETFTKALGARMSAYRLHSLVGVGGDDDYFSTDLPDAPDGTHVHPLSSSFGKLSVPSLALWSENDHCGSLDAQKALMDRWKEASKGKLEWRVITGASHAVEEEPAQKILCEEVVAWLGRHFVLD